MGTTIQIVEYDPQWVEMFNLEKEKILSLFGLEARVIEHVGSTSIPGQEAKPVVDIFVGVSPFKALRFYKLLFDSKHYQYIQTGMKERYVFAKKTNGIWTHNIHVMPYLDDFYTRSEILFRDYLRKHPELVREYGKAKKESAKNHGTTMEEYTRSKTEFIQKVMDAARKEKGLPLVNVWED